MGRPTFKIDQVRLRALREELGLTQAALAKKVAKQLGTPDTQSHERHYQRIEENGQTSGRYAMALATVLGVSVHLLQGLEDPDPSVYLQYIRRLLKEQLAIRSNYALQNLLEYHAKDGEETALEYLTVDIAERIEQVLLIRNPTKIADLIQLTGLSETDLLAPANVRGFWFISVRSRIINCTEFVDDSSSVNFRIGEIMREFLGAFGSDSKVRMWRDNPWIRIEIDRPRAKDRMQIDFTRFQPDATGLRWVDASWRDVFFLNPGIIGHAYATADVVTDFFDKTSPSDPHRLRLVVTEHDKTFGKVLRRMVVRGRIDEIPEVVKENFAEDCSTRILFVSWLTAGLRDALMPHLAALPASRWHVSTSGGAAVDIKIKDPRYPGGVFTELQYRIMLAEEVAPHTFDHVPVRERDLDQLKKKIEDWLAEGWVLSDGADPVPVFEHV
jgi:transcriptional regulator with XRE-family HTH domain